ncbi:hypothetical protein GCM10027188_21870 [Lysobacter humi (ex Lee et al. 2017)]
MQATFDDAATDARVRDAVAREPGRLWTLVPEHFDLERLDGEGSARLQLTTTVVEGHFERAGRPRWSGVRATLVGLEFRPLPRFAGPPSRARYRVLASGTRRHLWKLVDGRPDVDLVATIDDCPALAPGAEIATRWSDERAVAIELLRVEIDKSCSGTPLSVPYFDGADLR